STILVLIEETGSAIFSAFPNHFVLFGGAALLLFYESPRFSRDLDIHLLLSRGASLNSNLKAHLEDFVLLKDLDDEFIGARIQRIDERLCTAELRSVLPTALFGQFASKQFEPIRDSLRKLFSQWLVEN